MPSIRETGEMNRLVGVLLHYQGQFLVFKVQLLYLLPEEEADLLVPIEDQHPLGGQPQGVDVAVPSLHHMHIHPVHFQCLHPVQVVQFGLSR